MTASQSFPLQSFSRGSVFADLSPGQRTALVELKCSSAYPSPRRYRPIGSAIPLRRLDGLEVFPASDCGVRFVSNASPPVSFLAPSEYDRSGPPPDKPAAALLGFRPLQRIQLWKPGSLGFASPDTFRLQGFAPSCRFASSGAFRPCFMPVTLMGFTFRAFSPRRALDPLRSSDLHDVGAGSNAIQANSNHT